MAKARRQISVRSTRAGQDFRFFVNRSIVKIRCASSEGDNADSNYLNTRNKGLIAGLFSKKS